MADLRVKSSGKEFRRIDNGVALLLEEMFPEALERINSPEAVRPLSATLPASQAVNSKIPYAATPEWGLAKNAGDNWYIQLLIGRSELKYGGTPDGAVAAFKRSGYDVPREIVDRYKRLITGSYPIANDEALAKKVSEQAAADSVARSYERALGNSED